MAIPGDYPKPVMVNGYLCNNCTDVANAKKFVDPAHPDEAAEPRAGTARSSAVTFGGALASRSQSGALPDMATQATEVAGSLRLLDRLA